MGRMNLSWDSGIPEGGLNEKAVGDVKCVGLNASLGKESIMSGYEERQHAAEAKLAHDSELRFRVMNRRNRLLGQWVAERLGLTGEKAEDYARSVVRSDLEEPGDEDVVRKVMKDCAEAGEPLTHEQVRARMAELQRVALHEVAGQN